MALYFDTSALGPLFVVDAHSFNVENFLRGRAGLFQVSDLTMIELASVAARGVRARRLQEVDGHEALARANAWVSANCERIEVSPAEYRLGEDFVRRFELGLRAPDAIHVALCQRLGLTLLTCDAAQARAARALGVETTNLSGGLS